MTAPVILWFRRDLRLSDNMAIQEALVSNAPLIPLFIFDDAILRSERVGAPRVKFMLEALQSLDQSLRKLESRLIIRHGKPLDMLNTIVEETQAQAVYYNEDYTPFARQRDQEVQAGLNIKTIACQDMLLQAPGRVLKADGEPYVVFTPFKNQWLQEPVYYEPHRALAKNDFWQGELASAEMPSLLDLGYAESIDVLPASEDEAQRRLNIFVNNNLATYAQTRNYLTPDVFSAEQGTSILSPYLRFGLISVRQLYHTAQTQLGSTQTKETRESIETWVSELAWRDFYQHILWYFPRVEKHNFRKVYDAMQWRNNPTEFEQWQKGQTGYPIVDAAMRQLQAQGWMPNRARMIVASFLTKHLLIDWRWGELHFMQWLIDGDLAANNGGWQWSAGTGTDAQPYFRIFNPMSQSEKFDPTGDYIRAWIPELVAVESSQIHTPWILENPPSDYPPPLVDHRAARERALTTYKLARED